jgi:hypothetical protein
LPLDDRQHLVNVMGMSWRLKKAKNDDEGRSSKSKKKKGSNCIYVNVRLAQLLYKKNGGTMSIFLTGGTSTRGG